MSGTAEPISTEKERANHKWFLTQRRPEPRCFGHFFVSRHFSHDFVSRHFSHDLVSRYFSAVHQRTGHVPSLGPGAINLVLQPRPRGESEAKCVRPNQFPDLSTCTLKFDALGRFSKTLTDLTTSRVPKLRSNPPTIIDPGSGA